MGDWSNGDLQSECLTGGHTKSDVIYNSYIPIHELLSIKPVSTATSLVIV